MAMAAGTVEEIVTVKDLIQTMMTEAEEVISEIKINNDSIIF